MQWNNIYLNGCASELGRLEDVREAVRDGRYDPGECESNGYVSVSVTDGTSPPDLAVAAGRRALTRAGVPESEFGLVLHASVTFQGINGWTPTPYIQARTVGGTAVCMEVQQACNGGMAGIEAAAARISLDQGTTAALVTTADAFPTPAFDRYRCDMGTLRGDGATAAVVSRTPGPARLLSTALITDASHEGLSRGGEPWLTHSAAAALPWDLRARRVDYLASKGIGRNIVAMVVTRMQEVIDTALADAETAPDEVTRWVFTNLGPAFRYYWDFQRVNGIEEARTTWEWGRTVGHVGAGDHIAGLTHLFEQDTLRPGDRVAMVGVGGGFSFGCSVVEVLERSGWQP